eukprot:g13376.t1
MLAPLSFRNNPKTIFSRKQIPSNAIPTKINKMWSQKIRASVFRAVAATVVLSLTLDGVAVAAPSWWERLEACGTTECEIKLLEKFEGTDLVTDLPACGRLAERALRVHDNTGTSSYAKSAQRALAKAIHTNIDAYFFLLKQLQIGGAEPLVNPSTAAVGNKGNNNLGYAQLAERHNPPALRNRREKQFLQQLLFTHAWSKTLGDRSAMVAEALLERLQRRASFGQKPLSKLEVEQLMRPLAKHVLAELLADREYSQRVKKWLLNSHGRNRRTAYAYEDQPDAYDRVALRFILFLHHGLKSCFSAATAYGPPSSSVMVRGHHLVDPSDPVPGRCVVLRRGTSEASFASPDYRSTSRPPTTPPPTPEKSPLMKSKNRAAELHGPGSVTQLHQMMNRGLGGPRGPGGSPIAVLGENVAERALVAASIVQVLAHNLQLLAWDESLFLRPLMQVARTQPGNLPMLVEGLLKKYFEALKNEAHLYEEHEEGVSMVKMSRGGSGRGGRRSLGGVRNGRSDCPEGGRGESEEEKENEAPPQVVVNGVPVLQGDGALVMCTPRGMRGAAQPQVEGVMGCLRAQTKKATHHSPSAKARALLQAARSKTPGSTPVRAQLCAIHGAPRGRPQSTFWQERVQYGAGYPFGGDGVGAAPGSGAAVAAADSGGRVPMSRSERLALLEGFGRVPAPVGAGGSTSAGVGGGEGTNPPEEITPLPSPDRAGQEETLREPGQMLEVTRRDPPQQADQDQDDQDLEDDNGPSQQEQQHGLSLSGPLRELERQMDELERQAREMRNEREMNEGLARLERQVTEVERGVQRHLPQPQADQQQAPMDVDGDAARRPPFAPRGPRPAGYPPLHGSVGLPDLSSSSGSNSSSAGSGNNPLAERTLLAPVRTTFPAEPMEEEGEAGDADMQDPADEERPEDPAGTSVSNDPTLAYLRFGVYRDPRSLDATQSPGGDVEQDVVMSSGNGAGPSSLGLSTSVDIGAGVRGWLLPDSTAGSAVPPAAGPRGADSDSPSDDEDGEQPGDAAAALLAPFARMTVSGGGSGSVGVPFPAVGIAGRSPPMGGRASTAETQPTSSSECHFVDPADSSASDKEIASGSLLQHVMVDDDSFAGTSRRRLGSTGGSLMPVQEGVAEDEEDFEASPRPLVVEPQVQAVDYLERESRWLEDALEIAEMEEMPQEMPLGELATQGGTRGSVGRTSRQSTRQSGNSTSTCGRFSARREDLAALITRVSVSLNRIRDAPEPPSDDSDSEIHFPEEFGDEGFCVWTAPGAGVPHRYRASGAGGPYTTTSTSSKTSNSLTRALGGMDTNALLSLEDASQLQTAPPQVPPFPFPQLTGAPPAGAVSPEQTLNAAGSDGASDLVIIGSISDRAVQDEEEQLQQQQVLEQLQTDVDRPHRDSAGSASTVPRGGPRRRSSSQTRRPQASRATPSASSAESANGSSQQQAPSGMSEQHSQVGISRLTVDSDPYNTDNDADESADPSSTYRSQPWTAHQSGASSSGSAPGVGTMLGPRPLPTLLGNTTGSSVSSGPKRSPSYGLALGPLDADQRLAHQTQAAGLESEYDQVQWASPIDTFFIGTEAEQQSAREEWSEAATVKQNTMRRWCDDGAAQ